LRPFDRQQAKFSAHTAGRRKPAGFAAGSHDAVTRHKDRERILSKRLGDVARQIAVAEAFRDLAVGQRVAGRNGAGNVVNAPMKSGTASRSRTAPPKSLRSPPSSAMMSTIVRCTSAGGAASPAEGKRRSRRLRVARALASGSCTPTMPRSLQAMPQEPMAVSNNANPQALIV
jgi:hypothetical protein